VERERERKKEKESSGFEIGYHLDLSNKKI
jgi:hypothetical protein